MGGGVATMVGSSDASAIWIPGLTFGIAVLPGQLEELRRIDFLSTQSIYASRNTTSKRENERTFVRRIPDLIPVGDGDRKWTDTGKGC